MNKIFHFQKFKIMQLVIEKKFSALKAAIFFSFWFFETKNLGGISIYLKKSIKWEQSHFCSSNHLILRPKNNKKIRSRICLQELRQGLWTYRVFHAKCNIKNRHIFASGKAKKIPKTVLERSWIAIFYRAKINKVRCCFLYLIDMVLNMVIVKMSYFFKARFWPLLFFSS